MIVFASRTGNIRYIVSKIECDEKVELSPGLVVERPYILFTYTDGLGSVPQQVEQFLLKNSSWCRGVVVSGNQNFGHELFGRAGQIIAEKWQVPLLHKLDLRGFQKDYDYIQQKYDEIMSQ